MALARDASLRRTINASSFWCFKLASKRDVEGYFLTIFRYSRFLWYTTTGRINQVKLGGCGCLRLGCFWYRNQPAPQQQTGSRSLLSVSAWQQETVPVALTDLPILAAVGGLWLDDDDDVMSSKSITSGSSWKWHEFSLTAKGGLGSLISIILISPIFE